MEGLLFLADCDADGEGRGACLVRRVKVGLKWLNAVIDTGATINLLGELRLESVCPYQQVQKFGAQVYPYGTREPLPTVGAVVVEMCWDLQRLFVEFQVVRGKTDMVIGYSMAVVFGLVTITRPWRGNGWWAEGPRADACGVKASGDLEELEGARSDTGYVRDGGQDIKGDTPSLCSDLAEFKKLSGVEHRAQWASGELYSMKISKEVCSKTGNGKVKGELEDSRGPGVRGAPPSTNAVSSL